MKRILTAASLALICSQGLALAAGEHHAWQKPGVFHPISGTAEAITGPLTLSPGKIKFGKGKPIGLGSKGVSSQIWEDGKKRVGEVFALDADPGKLLNGNTLCGSHARYIVLSQDDGVAGPVLDMAVFESKSAPVDINSPGLCGTFSYELK